MQDSPLDVVVVLIVFVIEQRRSAPGIWHHARDGEISWDRFKV